MCHGAGGAHAVLKNKGAIFAFDWQEPRHTNNICLRCHSWKTSDVEWDATTHAKAGLKCSDCHDPHVKADSPYRFLLTGEPDAMCLKCHADVRRDFTRFSHHPVSVDVANNPGVEAMHCTDCHDVHAGHGRTMLAESSPQELCLKCHIDKSGPFRFVHASTQEGLSNGCLTCHNNHGSDNAWLHKADGRTLCIQCHTDREEHYQPLTCWTSGCHSQMHGTNSNLLFLR
jgi:DmsE family decaheme c-type cytochrome